MHQHRKTARVGKSSQARWQIMAVVGVMILVVVVLALKRTSPSATAPAASPATTAPTLNPEPTEADSNPVANSNSVAASNLVAPADGESPQAHLERMMAEGRPVFAFFHSMSCAQCIEMNRIVEQVHPDFAEQVALVDVDVYDEANQTLLQMAQIRVIPTLIFIDQAGEGKGFTGVMPADTLRAALQALAGDTP